METVGDLNSCGRETALSFGGDGGHRIALTRQSFKGLVMQTTIFDAIRTADRVINATAAKADREYEGWTTLAYSFLRKFVAERQEFYPWELVDASIEYGLAQPLNLRAWGGVYRRAVREGLIKRSDSPPRPHPYRHGTMTAGWVKV